MAARVDPIEALRGSGRSATRAGSRPQQTLVVLQAALSLVLLSAAGLLTTALQRLEHQPFGFEQDRPLVATMNPRLAGYRPAQLSTLYQRLQDAIAGIPGVSSVALCLLLAAHGRLGLQRLGRWPRGARPRDDNSSAWDRVTPSYFDVIGTPIVRGRGISDRDTASSRKVAVVSEAFARKFFGNEDPIGRYFGRMPSAGREFEIIGIVRTPAMWRAALDQPSLSGVLPARSPSRIRADEPRLAVPARHRDPAPARGDRFRRGHSPGGRSVDPGLPITSIRTLREQVSSQFTQPRLIARLTSFFGVLSLVLSSIGLYGVTAYNAARRTSEIGIRVALGAHRAARHAARAPRCLRTDVVRTCDRAAADVCCRATAPASVVRHEP